MNWNKKYIQGKEELPPIKIVGVIHAHSGGYYQEGCAGCIHENTEVEPKQEVRLPKYRIVEIYKQGEKKYQGKAHRVGWRVYEQKASGEFVVNREYLEAKQ